MEYHYGILHAGNGTTGVGGDYYAETVRKRNDGNGEVEVYPWQT